MGKKEQDKFRGEIEMFNKYIKILKFVSNQKIQIQTGPFYSPIKSAKKQSGRRVEENMLLWPTDQSVTWHNFFEAIKL